MTIRFERSEKVTRYLDPRAGFQEARIVCQVRRDPLTSRSGRIAHVPGFHLAPVDFRQMIADSRATCPFCPERIFEVTPRFPADVVPEGRCQRSEAVVFPNLAPYDEHSTVAVMSREHDVPMGRFTPQLLADDFGACLDFFRSGQRLPATTYSLVFWN